MRKKNILRIIACLFLVCACNDSRQDQTESRYRTLEITRTDQTLLSDYTARLKGRQEVEIRPQVGGLITEIRINEGDAVKKGQILFVIDQVPYKAALATAIANVRSAEAQLATAQLTAQSKETLYQERIISDFELRTARNALAEAEAVLAQAQAQALNARNDYSYTEVKSPVNGKAGMIPYRVGALVGSNLEEPLVTVSDDSEIYAYFSMTESQILDLTLAYGSLDAVIEKMPEVGLTMSNGQPYAHPGKIDAISGNIDESTGAVSIRAVFPNPERLLRNGGNGMVQIPSVRTGCVVIPQAATYELQNRVFAYKVVDGKAKSTPIEVFKLSNGTEYIVESGLEAGDVIVAEGAGLMREGTVITNETTQE